MRLRTLLAYAFWPVLLLCRPILLVREAWRENRLSRSLYGAVHLYVSQHDPSLRPVADPQLGDWVVLKIDVPETGITMLQYRRNDQHSPYYKFVRGDEEVWISAEDPLWKDCNLLWSRMQSPGLHHWAITR